jgi:hypothetical protein
MIISMMHHRYHHRYHHRAILVEVEVTALASAVAANNDFATVSVLVTVAVTAQ